MINPTNDDIGRRVSYLGHHGPHAGTIVTMNEHYVFVRYDGEVASKATARDMLDWEDAPTAAAIPDDEAAGTATDDDDILSDVIDAGIGLAAGLAGDSDDDGFSGGGGDFGGGGASGSW